MIIIVPEKIEGLSYIEDSLEFFNHTRLEESGTEREIQLYLPKFKIESSIDLTSSLSNVCKYNQSDSI